MMITIIGAGRVGSSTAMRIADMNLDDVMLIDIVKGLPIGEALDISQSCNFDVSMKGSNDFKDMKGSDLVINTAGLARKPGMTRLDLMRKNAEITKSVASEIKRHAPESIVIQVANPIDLMAMVMLRHIGFERERVFAMGGMLDSQRFRYFISQQVGVSPRAVEAMVIGEHGDSMVPLVSQARVEGNALTELLKPEGIRQVLARTRGAGMEVINQKGSTFYAPSIAVARMAEAVVKDAKAVMPASVMLQGEYGEIGVYAGVPAKLGKAGMLGVAELEIDDGERQAFAKSCGILRGKAKELGL